MKRIIIAMAVFLVAPLVIPGYAADTLRVSTSIKPPLSTQDETGFLDLLLKEMGERIGMKVELVRLPPERALVFANEGQSDMELPRIAGLQMTYPNLIQLEESVIDYRFVAFTRGENAIRSWEDLEGKRVGYLIGWKIFESNVPAGAHVTKLRKSELLFEMLHQGRIDVALHTCVTGWNIIKSSDYANIKECSVPLAVKPMYPYLNKGVGWLSPVITEALRDMKADGTYRELADTILKMK